MAVNANGNGAPFNVTLRTLPLPVRLTLSLFLIAVGLGYFAALLQLHFRDATKGQPLPTPNDMVEIFSGVEGWPVPKPAPPKPVSKLEQLIMGSEDEPLEPGATSMAKAFFTGDKHYRELIKEDPSKLPRLHDEREGERLALQAWINLPEKDRQKAYENDEMDPKVLADPNHAITKRFKDQNGQIRVNTIIDQRCAQTCHISDSAKGKKQLRDYPADFADVLVVPTVGHTSRQMSVESLTQTTHLHLLSFCMLWTLTGLVFAFSSYWKGLRCIVAPLVLLAQVADVSCWWLARLPNVGPYFALAVMGTGAVVAIGLLLQIVLSLLDMYKWPGRMILLVLFIGAVVGAALLTPHVQKYLKDEAAPPPAAPAPQAPAAPAPEK